MKKIIVLVIAIFTINIAEAQWVQTSLTYSEIYALAVHGDTIFAGSGYDGVFLSTDKGNNWTVVNTGLTNLKIQALVINNSNIFAGTQSKGVWERSISEVLGIKENTLNNNVMVYPNPAKDNLTIETNTTNIEQRIEIINLVGKTIYTNIINRKTIINTSAFANGVYILKLYTDKETVVKKFVKE